MKISTAAALTALVCLAAAPALAQTPAATPPAAPAAAAPAGKLSINDTPIEQLVAKPETKAVLDKDLPGLTSHPAFEQFKGMTLKQLQPMSQGALTDAQLDKVQADLNAVAQ